MLQYLSERKNRVIVISMLLILIVFFFPLWYEDFNTPPYPGSPLSKYFNYPMCIGFSFILQAPQQVLDPRIDVSRLRHFPIRIDWRSSLEQIFVIAVAAAYLYRATRKQISDNRFLVYLSLWTPLVLQYFILQFSGINFIYRFTYLMATEQSYPITIRPFMILVTVIAYTVVAGIIFSLFFLINKCIKNIAHTRAS
jgi:hypothetical protein